MEDWNVAGRKRMDDLLKPGTNMLPEERVMYTMELQSDIEAQIAKHEKQAEEWAQIQPTKDAEKTEDAEVLLRRS